MVRQPVLNLQPGRGGGGGGGGKRQVLQLLQFHVRGVQDRLHVHAKQSPCADTLEHVCFLFATTSQTSGARG